MSVNQSRNIIDLTKVEGVCKHCNTRHICWPFSLQDHELEQLQSIVRQGRPLVRGEHIFRAGEQFTGIYIVRSGSIKSYITTEDGEEQVTGFLLSGELLGFDGICHNRHGCSAIALDTTIVCRLSMDDVELLARQIPNLLHHLMRLMSLEIFRDEMVMQLLSKKTAEERLAILLIDLCARFQVRGFAATEFHLPMSRTDIANYLGLALETVCRTFSRFQEEGLLSIDRKNIEIHNIRKLQRLAGVTEQCEHVSIPGCRDGKGS